MENKTKEFIKKEILAHERNVFLSSILLISLGYVGITLWLNAIRATAQLWFVWVLIVIQLILYFSIFVVSYQRAKVYGLRRFGFALFLILAVLGRVENWELFIIPLVVLGMLVVSAKNKNVSNEMKHVLED